jgi:phage baseplate assembly protein W
MQPNLGGDIQAMLFENITPSVITLIEDKVRDTIEINEPRAELVDVIVSSNIDDNQVNVKIVFYIKNVEQPIALDVFLERTR